MEVNNFKGTPIHRFDFKNFAKMPVAAGGWDDDEAHVTVRDLVKHFAHREGGVHYDGDFADNALLTRLMESDRRAMDLTMLALGRVVLHALEPLAYKIMIDLAGWLDPHRAAGMLQIDGTMYRLVQSFKVPDAQQ